MNAESGHTALDAERRRVAIDGESGHVAVDRGSRHVAIDALALALLLGIAGDLLLRTGPFGLSAPLAAFALAAGFSTLVHGRHLPLKCSAAWLAAVPLLAAVLAWRSSPPLILLAVFGVLLALVSAALSAHGRTLMRAGSWDIVAETVATGLHTAFGPLPLLRDIHRAGIRWTPRDSRAGAILRGAVLAIPPLIVFGGLLMAADAAFAQIVGEVLRLDFEELASHVFLVGIFGWIAAGYLHWVALNDGRRVPRASAIGIRLGTVEVGMVLGAVTALFVTFIGIQSAYLFGGEARVLATTGLTYAEYARRGFFELVTVAFLLLPLLLLALWAVRDAPVAKRRGIRMLAGSLQLLAVVLMGSALYRMRLYQEAYGLTQLRFYTTAFMGWLALVFVLFAATVLRERPRRFAAGVVGSALAGVLLLAAANPDARIVETNIERAHAGAQFDHTYVRADLGADAVPALVRALDELPADGRCATAAWLLEHWGNDSRREGDWRTWNYARDRARRMVRGNEASLREMACPAE